jgi:hypothetical protein
VSPHEIVEKSVNDFDQVDPIAKGIQDAREKVVDYCCASNIGLHLRTQSVLCAEQFSNILYRRAEFIRGEIGRAFALNETSPDAHTDDFKALYNSQMEPAARAVSEAMKKYAGLVPAEKLLLGQNFLE